MDLEPHWEASGDTDGLGATGEASGATNGPGAAGEASGATDGPRAPLKSKWSHRWAWSHCRSKWSLQRTWTAEEAIEPPMDLELLGKQVESLVDLTGRQGLYLVAVFYDTATLSIQVNQRSDQD